MIDQSYDNAEVTTHHNPSMKCGPCVYVRNARVDEKFHRLTLVYKDLLELLSSNFAGLYIAVGNEVPFGTVRT
jgi:hypothetical protein